MHMQVLLRLEASMTQLKVTTATKEDLKSLKSEIITETKAATKLSISEAVDPLKQEMYDVQQRSQKASQRWKKNNPPGLLEAIRR